MTYPDVAQSFQRDLPLAEGLEASRIAPVVRRVLDQPGPGDWRATGLDRMNYLRLAEPMVRALAPNVDEQGAVIDPVEQLEHGQTTSRFASSAGILLAFGLAEDLLETACRTMDHTCRRLGAGEAKSPDFQMRELVTALWCLEPIVGEARAQRWRDDLRRVDPERHYWYVESDEKPIETLHNWTIFGMAGEWMRRIAGIGAEIGRAHV